MRAVKAEVTSSKPISLSKAATALSHFAASETGAQPDVSAYLRRAVTAFEELVTVHCEIQHQRKITQGQKDDGSHWKRNENEMDCEVDAHEGNSLLEQQRLGIVFDENFGSIPVEANGLLEEKNVKGKGEEKWKRVRDVTEYNGVLSVFENKKLGKERKKELNKDEMKCDEVENYGTGSVERRDKKKRKQKEDPERVFGERKKRKHLDAENGRMDGK